MKKICLINKGENLQKINYRYNLDVIDKEIKNYNDLKYIELERGSDDIVIVKNYNPYFVRRLNNNESILDIYSKGYNLVGEYIDDDNLIVYSKPTGIKYNVKPLESIEDIAKRFGVDVDYIINNNLLITKKLFVGQELII